MPTKVPISLGKIVDKLTITNIRISKTKDDDYKQCLLKEKDKLQNYMKKDEKFLASFNDLSRINKEIWTLKDLLTNSSKRFHNPETAQTGMHYYNMLCQLFLLEKNRELTKNELNKLYDNDCVTKYIYSTLSKKSKNTSEVIVITEDDKALFQLGQNASSTGDYIKSYNIFIKLAEKFENANYTNKFIILVYVIHASICSFIGKISPYIEKLKGFLNDPLLNTHMNEQEIDSFRYNYAFEILLPNGKYEAAKPYSYNAQQVTATTSKFDINPHNMSYLDKDDKDKSLLIYCAGGMGDKIMHSRFIPIVCKKAQERNNKVIFLVDDSLKWLFDSMFHHIENLSIVEMKNRDNLSHFDKHINLTVLFMYMNYSDLTLPPPYYIDSNTPSGLESEELMELCQPIFAKTKKNIVFNWHGSFTNHHENKNRGTSLNEWIPLFTNCDVNWISVQPAFTEEEEEIMKKYNIINLGPVLDKEGDAFKDTIEVMRYADLCVSTDTSIAHFGATLNINMYIMLTVGSAWQWSKEKRWDWYPNLKVLRQNELFSWSNVMKNLQENISKL